MSEPGEADCPVVMPCMHRELVACDRLSCVRTFTRLYDALATPENGVGPGEGPEAASTMAEMWFLFSLIWGLGGSLDEEGRKKFNTFMRWVVMSKTYALLWNSCFSLK